jgi:hypothetical protein
MLFAGISGKHGHVWYVWQRCGKRRNPLAWQVLSDMSINTLVDSTLMLDYYPACLENHRYVWQLRRA